MIIVDSHCHLDMLKDYDSTDNIVARAAELDVKYLQTICTRLDHFENILSIAKKYDNVFASVGVLPRLLRTTHMGALRSLVVAEQDGEMVTYHGGKVGGRMALSRLSMRSAPKISTASFSHASQ